VPLRPRPIDNGIVSTIITELPDPSQAQSQAFKRSRVRLKEEAVMIGSRRIRPTALATASPAASPGGAPSARVAVHISLRQW
jgi:hypothetical protein